MRIIDGLDLSNQQLHNLADGSAATDAVTLQQLQAFVRGLDWKASVRAASTANVNVASPGASIDGVAFAITERALLKNQTTAAENGIYVWNGAAAPMTRATDAAVGTLSAGLAVLATEGTVNADTAWVLTTNDPVTVGTTSLTFAQFGGNSAPYTQGNGILISSNQISVQAVANGGISVQAGGIQIDFAKVATKFSTNVGDGSTTTINVTHGLNTTDISPVLKEVATKEVVGIKFVVADANTVTMNFPTAPTVGQYRITVIA